MTPNQINLVQTTFNQIAPDAETLATDFYARLFAIRPSLQMMFPADLSEQKKKLMSILKIAVESLDRFEQLRPALENLGRKHLAYGVASEHYATVGAALLWTLERHLGADFTPAVEAAWSAVYGALANTMREAARDAQTQPSIDLTAAV